MHSPTAIARRAAWAAFAWAALGCGGDTPTKDNPPPPPPPSAPYLELVSGGGQQDTVAQLLAAPLTVRAFDADSLPLSGASVRFVLPTRRPISSSGPPSADTVLVTTDAQGAAAATWTLPEVAGTYHALASITGSAALRIDAVAIPGPPDSLALLGVVDYGAPLGGVIPDSIRLRVTDRYGNVAAGVPLTAMITKGTGSLPASSVQTSSTGLAAFSWVLSSTPGFDSLLITGGGLDTIRVEAATFAPPAPDSVAAGPRHSCAIGVTTRCWGDDTTGAVTGGSGRLTVPSTVATPEPLQHVAAGSWVSCGIGVSGALYCWGRSTWMGLAAMSPQLVHAGTAFRSLTLGRDYGCGVALDWQVRCWGLANLGQIGLPGGSGYSTQLAGLGGGARFRQVSAGLDATCGVTVGAHVWCWGTGPMGRGLPYGWGYSPAAVASTEHFAQVATGYGHACAITLDGRLLCWGRTYYGGPDPVVASGTPLAVASTLRFRRVVADSNLTCAIATDDAVYCFGNDHYASNGSGTVDQATTAPTQPVLSGAAFRDVAVGSAHACGRLVAGSVVCWGGNGTGQAAGAGGAYRTVPDTVSGGLRFTALRLAEARGCGLAAGGVLWCWGDNAAGRLGTGDTVDQFIPVVVAGGAAFTGFEIGAYGGCGLAAGGTATCWGKMDPVPGTLAADAVPSASFTSVVVSGGAACGLGTDAVTRCWGENAAGALGDGTLLSSPTPVVVAGNHLFTALTADDAGTCGLEADGSAWCWGGGPFGDNTGIASSSVPRPVAGTLRFSRLLPNRTVGGFSLSTRRCGVTNQGETWCWGLLPALVDLGFPVTSIQGLFTGGCVLGSDGQARCAGANWYGELGDGTTVGRQTFGLVAGNHQFMALTAAGLSACGLATDGTVWCWGGNQGGQLGWPGVIIRVPLAVP